MMRLSNIHLPILTIATGVTIVDVSAVTKVKRNFHHAKNDREVNMMFITPQFFKN